MKNGKIFKGMVVLMILAFTAWTACAQTLPSAASASATVTPTNMVLDYELTHVDSNLGPGDSGILVVVIKNVGTQAAENVQLSIPATSDVSVDKRWDLGRMDPLTSKSVSTTITISKDAAIGLHTVPVKISFDGYDQDGTRRNNQLTSYDLPIRIYGNANFQLAVQQVPFYKDVSTKLVITGTTQYGARDLFATLIPVTSAGVSSATAASAASTQAACASILGSSRTYLGSIGKGQSFELDYLIQPHDIGVCSFGLQLDYSDVSGNPLKETLPLGIDVQRYNVDFKVTDVSFAGASPGSVANITVSIENVGNSEAKDASVTLDLNTPFTAIGSSETYVGQFGSKSSKDLNFQASVDSAANIQAYDIPLTITYYDLAGTQHSIQKSIGLQVDGKPEIKAILESTSLFGPGSKGTVTVMVVNKGFAQVKFLNLKMLPTKDYDVTSASEAYIGNLDSDSTDSQDFTIQLNNNVSAGTIPMLFQVTYKEQNSNIDHIDPVQLNLNVLSIQDYTQKQPTGSPLSLLLSGVGILVGLVVAYIVLWFLAKLIGVITGFLDRKLFKRKG